jgi:hypothetical protein
MTAHQEKINQGNTRAGKNNRIWIEHEFKLQAWILSI